jgi:hypothetical protein
MGFFDIGCLLVACMADVTEIAKGVRLMPARVVAVDRQLRLNFMTVFARGRLRAALGFDRSGGQQPETYHHDQKG